MTAYISPRSASRSRWRGNNRRDECSPGSSEEKFNLTGVNGDNEEFS